MKREVITHKDPKSPISEIFRSLRTNIQFTNSSKGLKTILVTSTVQSEGKSWITSNLAVTFAQAGKKVIIVDADMRKGRQYNIFSVDPLPGLSNYLSGIDENGDEAEENILAYIKETEVDNLYVIPAGNVPPNPSELLITDKMAKLLTRLKELCDVIIFDGTPSILVTDAVILSRVVDTTIIVTTHKETKMDNLQKVKRAIENVGGNIAGVIINKMPISSKKYEDRYYYGSKKLNTPEISDDDSVAQSVKISESKKNYNKSKTKLEPKKRQTTKKSKVSDSTTRKKNQDETPKEEIENTETKNMTEDIRIPDIGIVNTENINVENAEEILNQMKEYLTYEKSQLKKGEKE